MKKSVLVILCVVLAFAVLFVSCKNEVDNKPSVAEEQRTEANSAIAKMGTASSVQFLGSSLSKGSRDIESETEAFLEDEDGVTSLYALVSFSELKESISDHIDTVEKIEINKPVKITTDKTDEDLFLLRFCYFDDSSSPAFREIYLIDPDCDLSGDTLIVTKLSLSPDFKYDILNQLDIETGEAKKYEWKSGTTSTADQFVEDKKTDLSALIDGITGQWIFVGEDGVTPVTRTHVAASYILEVDKANADAFYDYKLGSFSSEHLRIKNFTYENEDKTNKVYFLVEQYPEGYKHDWSVRCYWYEDSKWNYTRELQTDEDLISIEFKDITSDENIAAFFEEINAIGNITKIYQAYKSNEAYYLNGKVAEFVVEFNRINGDNLLEVITNDKGKQTRTSSSIAGALQKDTVAYMSLYYYTDSDDLKACIIIPDKYTSYTYLTIEMVDGKVTINGKNLSGVKSYKDLTSDEYIASFFDEVKAIGTVSKIYQLYLDDEPYLEGSYEEYIVEFSSASAKLREAITNDDGTEFEDSFSDAGDLPEGTVAFLILRHNTESNDLRACIIDVTNKYSSYSFLPLVLVGERLAIDDQYLDDLSTAITYKDITSESVIEGFYEEVKAIGNISRIYRSYVGENPYFNYVTNEYIVEFSSVSENLLAAITNDQGKKAEVSSSEAGELGEDTVAYLSMMHNSISSNIRACIFDVANEYSSYTHLPLRMIDDRLAIDDQFLDDLSSIYYDVKTEKCRDISRYDGKLYYSEYLGDYNAIMGQLGTVDKVVFYKGKTGQEKPYIQSFNWTSSKVVSIGVQFTSFNQDVLTSYSISTSTTKTYFATESGYFGFDYDDENLYFAELAIWYDAKGDIETIKVGIVTDSSKMEENEYATIYKMNTNFLEQSE